MSTENTNAPRAHIACVSADGTIDEALTASFKHAGYLIALPNMHPADISLVDMRGKRITIQKAKALVARLRKHAPEASILFIIDAALDARTRTALKRFGETVPAGMEFEHVVERCRQILRLRNIADETGERIKTLASLNRLIEFPPITTSQEPINVLIAGKPGTMAMSVTHAISKVANNFTCVLSAGQILRAIDHEKFDCAIFLPTPKDSTFHSVTRAVRRHPKYIGLPIIHVANHEDDLKQLAQSGGAEFILQQHVPRDLGARIQLSTRRARLLRSMRGFLQACNGDGVRDIASGAFTATYLSEHGARLCARADQTGRPLTMVLIQLSCDDQTIKMPKRKALHRATQLINRITRAEDITARITPDSFLVLCPATTNQDAAHLAQRIEGVIANMVFRGTEEHSLHAIHAETTTTSRERGTAIEEVVANLLKVAKQKHTAKPHQQFPQ